MLKATKNESAERREEEKGEGGPCLMNKGDVKFRRSGFDAVVSALRPRPTLNSTNFECVSRF